MRDFWELIDTLSKEGSDVEVALELSEYLAKFGIITDARRFTTLEDAKEDKRHFLISFKKSSDARKAIDQLKLRSFAFDSVLIELKRGN